MNLLGTFIKTVVICLLTCIYIPAHAKNRFIENIGQFTDQHQKQRADIYAKFDAGNGLNIFLSKTGIHYQWSTQKELYRMDVKLLCANIDPVISKEWQTGYWEKYLLNDIQGEARSYKKITYHNIYPYIDWVFYFNEEGSLEHDFIVKPGGKVSDIRLAYEGADELVTTKSGGLHATTAFGAILENAPYTYELSGKRKVRSHFVLKDNILSFNTASSSGTIVIDPVIDWSTYIGGADYDEVWDTKIGKDGMVYVVGATNSTSNIATTGAHLTSFAGGSNIYGSDAFLMKFNKQGLCQWGTYIGGPNVELGMTLALDTADNIYIAGRTNSLTGISTTGTHQELKAGSNASYDAYLMKFDTSGQRIWGTYYGGTGAEGTESIALSADRLNNIFLIGNTQSNNGIATTGAFQAVRPGGNDGFIAKFNTSGALSWSTYLGTASNDMLNAVQTDTAGNIVVTGHTQSITGLASPGAYLQTGNGGTDGFVAKFDSTGNRVWATYYGGTAYDKLNYITTDNSGAVYVSGTTESTSDIATPNAHQSTSGGGLDMCLLKLNANGQMLWSTFYGGSGNENSGGLSFKNGLLYFTGETMSASGIATADGIHPVFNGSISEIMLASFTPFGQRTWGTYLGGDDLDVGKALAIENDHIFIGGKTVSVNNLASTGAHQVTFGGSGDGILLSINMCILPDNPISITGATTVCQGTEQVYRIPQVNGATSYLWNIPTGWTGSSTADSISLTVGNVSGDIKVVATNACGTSDTASLTVNVNPAPIPLISRNGNILSVNQSYDSYQWIRNSQVIAGANGASFAVSQNGNYTLRVTGINACAGLSNEIEVNNATGIKDVLARKGIIISPNPFSTNLSLNLTHNARIRIIDLSGRLLIERNLKAGVNIIDTEELNTGSFLIQIFNAQGNFLGAMQLSKTNL